MPSVTLTDLWLHDDADRSSYITFDGGTEAVTTSKVGENRRMANGRIRAVDRVGDVQSLAITAPYITQAAFDQLEDWVQAGTLLMLRDAKRRVRWGRIYSINGTVSQAAEESVSFTFEPISYVETV